MIAARVRFPTTQIMINDQGFDALAPTRHELVSVLSRGFVLGRIWAVRVRRLCRPPGDASAPRCLPGTSQLVGVRLRWTRKQTNTAPRITGSPPSKVREDGRVRSAIRPPSMLRFAFTLSRPDTARRRRSFTDVHLCGFRLAGLRGATDAGLVDCDQRGGAARSGRGHASVDLVLCPRDVGGLVRRQEQHQ